MGTLLLLAGLLLPAFPSADPGIPPMAPAPSANPAAAAALHLRLARSVPAADTTLPSPPEIRLHFSQAPQPRSTSIRLFGPGDAPRPLGAVEPVPSDPLAFRAGVGEPLPSGAYRVEWRTMASDGHVIRGSFAFRVAPD